jgi:phospholipid/cholesterol/gamma-HCH transport system permease protein
MLSLFAVMTRLGLKARLGYGIEKSTATLLMLHRASDVVSRYHPACQLLRDGEALRIAVSGDWTLAVLEEAQNALQAIGQIKDGARAPDIDLAGLQMLDTAGALVLTRLRESAGAKTAGFLNARPEHRVLLEEVARAASLSREALPPGTPIADFVKHFVSGLTAIGRDAVRLTMFLGEAAAALGRVIAKPSKFRGTAFIHQIQATGLTAVPIISLVCVLIGGVIMQQGARQLRNFGAETLSIDMLGILALREVGVVLAAVMVAGRSASAFTAQIGTMKMREEIDAMRTLGIDPIETLVLPRILALILVLPLLVFVADIMCLAGGAIMAKIYLALDTPVYLQRLNAAVTAKHFYVGLIKAPFVALVIGLVGCLEGLRVEGSAESVGKQVTTAVVKAIFLVLVLDGVFAIFLSASGF